MSKGTVQVSFAGTFEEARDYAKQHGVNAPIRLARSGCDDGLPMLSLPYNNKAERDVIQQRFVELGWFLDDQEISHPKAPPH